MRLISLREFRTRGAKALEAVPTGETILLSGQDGPAYFLVPVQGDVAAQDAEIQLAMARASLLRNRQLAAEAPMTMEEIDEEIRLARRERAAKRKVA